MDINFDYFDLIDKERNVYELASLHPQNRREINEYIDVLQDPISGQELQLEGENLIGEKT